MVVGAGLFSSCFHKKYETPITKNTQQPDKVLFDQAVKDIEHGRYEVARLSLQTLMNTYESSEYLAKAKLAIADSWYREGGVNGLTQAEAEYKDFILFYPNMEEAAQAQSRVCDIHYKQMDKSDRDWSQALRAEDECRQLLVQFPNSKFAPEAQQRLRDIQEDLAQHEFDVGHFYFVREMSPAAANRLDALVDQYPLFSKSDEALYEAGQSYAKMGPRFRQKAADMYSRIARDYPLSARAGDAKKQLEEMEMPVPQPDRAAYDRMKFEQENYKRPSLLARSMEFLKGSPDVSHAAKSGAPTMSDPKRTLPASIPVPAPTTDTASSTTGSGTGTTDVTAKQVGPNSALDKGTDARSSGGTALSANNTAAANAPLPTNRDKDLAKLRAAQAKKQAKLDKKKKKEEQKDQNAQGSQQQQGQTQSNQSNASQGSQASPGVSNTTTGTPGSTPSTPQPQQ